MELPRDMRALFLARELESKRERMKARRRADGAACAAPADAPQSPGSFPN